MDALSLEGVEYAWPGRSGFRLSVPAFAMAGGERVLLLGPSGSGKSTLLALVTGIAVPSAGRVTLLGQDLSALSSSARDRFRAEHVGVIFQMFNLLPYASAVDNALLPLSFAPGRRRRVGAAPREEALRLLDALGLDREAVRATRAGALSVGQQQRVAVARALIGRPEIVVADEPTSALDARSQAAFLDLLFGQVAESGASLLLVSHDERLAPRFDRVVALPEIATGAEAA